MKIDIVNFTAATRGYSFEQQLVWIQCRPMERGFSQLLLWGFPLITAIRVVIRNGVSRWEIKSGMIVFEGNCDNSANQVLLLSRDSLK